MYTSAVVIVNRNP